MKALSERPFGVEFEFLNMHSAQFYGRRVQAALQEFPGVRLLVTQEYRHSPGDRWELKSDSSCGWELVSPVLRWPQWLQVERALAALRDAGAQVNEQCGMHVHHECRDYSQRHLRRLLLLWALFENLLYGAVEESRQGNGFCQSVTGQFPETGALLWRTRSSESLRETADNHFGHHSVVNLQRWWHLGVVEFRLHHGTLRPDEARKWVLLTQSFTELALTHRWRKSTMKFIDADAVTKLRLLRKALAVHSDHPEVLELAQDIQERVQRLHPSLLVREDACAVSLV